MKNRVVGRKQRYITALGRVATLQAVDPNTSNTSATPTMEDMEGINGLQSGDASLAFGSFQKNVRQLESVRTFAIDFMRTLSATFCMNECSDEKNEMKKAMSSIVAGLKRPRDDEPERKPMPVSEAVRRARTIIGKNNDIYLQVGISMLWTGDAGSEEKFDTDAVDDSNTLFPSSIKSYGQMQQLSVDATALSLLRGRKEALEMRQRNLKDELQHTLFPLLAYLLSIPSLNSYAFAEFEKISKKIDADYFEKEEIDSTVTEQLRYTTNLWTEIKPRDTRSPPLYDEIKEFLKKQLNEAKSSAKFRELMGACVTLIDILLPLLQTEETQPFGALNMAIVNTSLCDAAANRTQFTPTTLLAMQPFDADKHDAKLYHAALNVNKDLVEQIESMDLNFKAPKGTLPSSLFSPLAKSKAEAPVSKDLRPPFSPLKIVGNSTLTALQMMPVYTCATRQLFCTPSPTQTYNDQPFRWYNLPMGSEIKRSGMRSEAEDDVWRVWDQAVFQPTKAEQILIANALSQETIVSNFTPTLRYKVVGSEILKTSVVSGDRPVYVDSNSNLFKSLPTTFAQWMPLHDKSIDGSTSDVDVNQFSLSPLSRSACRAAVLGALVVGAESILEKFDAARHTSIKRFVALVKLHQLGPLLYTRNDPNQWNQWNTSKYLATLNVETNDESSSYMEAPLPPLYIDESITPKLTFELESYAFARESAGESAGEFVGTDAVKVLPLKILEKEGKQKMSITRVWTSFDQNEEFNYTSKQPSTPSTIESMRMEDTTNSLTNQHNLLSSLRTMLQGRPYNRSIANETLDESYADDGRPLLRLFHHTLMANRTLLHQCQRHNESIELFSDMLNRTYDGKDAQKSARRVNPDTSDEGFYQGSAALEAQRQRGVPDAVERGRREAVWKDALRELTVSGDRLFVFLKTLAGLLHDDVQNIIKMEDRSMEQAQRVRAEQRREALRATMSFSQRSMDALMGAIFRQSNFRLDVDASQDGSDEARNMTGELVVVSEETVERIRKLANDTNNRSFFEAQTQLTSFLEKNKGVSMPLQSLIQGVRSVIRTQLTESLDMANRIDVHDERGAMDFLAQPRNSLIIRLKNETFAAIRQAYDALEMEMIAQGYRLMLGSVTVYACVEGKSRRLCDQFAALSAYFMSQSRLFSSSASVYVSTQSASSNALMLRVALQKCVMRAVEYHRGQY